MSKLVSTRLEDELAEWVESYRVSRGWSRAELIDAALRSYRQVTRSGVPDLPAPPVPLSRREADAVERKRIEDAAYVEMQRAHGARQQKLNDAKYGRAS